MGDKQIKKIGVLTSGGDAPGMNAAIRAITKAALAYGVQVVGIPYGYDGLLCSEVSGKKADTLHLDDIRGIIKRGGTMLKTSRSKYFREKNAQELAINTTKYLQLDALVVLGGDGSYAGAKKLIDLGLIVACIPYTIDGDVKSAGITGGLSTALNSELIRLNKIKDTSDSHNRLVIFETMGKKCGLLPFFLGVSGGVEEICVPEKPFDISQMAERIKRRMLSERTKNIIVVVAEGCLQLSDAPKTVDDFAEELRILVGLEKDDVLVEHRSYSARGGDASAEDCLLGTMYGISAVQGLVNGEKNFVVSFMNGDIQHIPFKEAMNMQNHFPTKIYEAFRLMEGIS